MTFLFRALGLLYTIWRRYRRDIIKIQQNWIGACDGTKLELKVTDADESVVGKVSVFTDRPELIFSANAVFLKPENIVNKEGRSCEGELANKLSLMQ